MRDANLKNKVRWEIIRTSKIRRVRFSNDKIFGATISSDDFKLLGKISDVQASGIKSLSI